MKRFIQTLAIALLPLPAFAYFQCDAQITNVLFYADGSVAVRHTKNIDYTYICNLKTERQGVATATCSMWSALLLRLKENGGTAQFYYNGTGSCPTLQLYQYSQAPWYIGDMAP